jgi:hypothetical protein
MASLRLIQNDSLNRKQGAFFFIAAEVYYENINAQTSSVERTLSHSTYKQPHIEFLLKVEVTKRDINLSMDV